MSYRNLLVIILIQASLAMLGSLYFSNFWDPLNGLFSGTGFEPCRLCWRGRILMYPLVVISVYGLIRKDKGICFLTGALSLVGVLLAGYHYLIQYQASLNVFSCQAGNDCTHMGWHKWLHTYGMAYWICNDSVSWARGFCGDSDL